MAVPKSKISRAKGGSRRAHLRASRKTISIDGTSGEKHVRHCVTDQGFYRGERIFGEGAE